MSQQKRKTKAVFTIIEREGLARGVWVRIGRAFENSDGSTTIRLDALPLGGSLHVRDVDAPPARVTHPAAPAQRPEPLEAAQ